MSNKCFRHPKTIQWTSDPYFGMGCITFRLKQKPEPNRWHPQNCPQTSKFTKFRPNIFEIWLGRRQGEALKFTQQNLNGWAHTVTEATGRAQPSLCFSAKGHRQKANYYKPEGGTGPTANKKVRMSSAKSHLSREPVFVVFPRNKCCRCPSLSKEENKWSKKNTSVWSLTQS